MTFKLFSVHAPACSTPCVLPDRSRVVSVVLLTAFSLFALSFSPSSAAACSCMIQSIEDARRSSSAIFEGRVDRVSVADQPAGDSSDTVVLSLEVVRSFQGASHEHVELRTAGKSAACGATLEQGKSYLVYASAHEGDDKLWVSLCSRTKPIEQAGEDLTALGMGVTPFDPGPGSEQKMPPSGPVTAGPSARNAHGGCASCTIGAVSDAEKPASRSLAALAGLFLLIGYRITCRRRSEPPL